MPNRRSRVPGGWRIAAVVGFAVMSLCACVVPNTSAAKAPTPPPATAEMSARIRTLENRVRQGDAAKAREELEAQVTAHPQDLAVHFLLAWVGAPSEEAMQQLHRIATDAPNDPWPHYGMARIYIAWRIYDQAQRELDLALAPSGQFVPALCVRGAMLREEGNLDGAKKAYEAALRISPNDVDALAGLGQTLGKLGDEAGGRSALEKALAGDPNCYEAVAALAGILAKGTDVDAALKTQAKLAELSPTDRSVFIALAKLNEKKGDAKAAASAYETALKLAPDATVARSLADLYDKLADKDGEARALEALVKLDAKNVEAHIRLAELKSDDPQAVDQHLKAASERAPQDPALRLRLARLLEKQGDDIEALENYRLAVAGGVKDGTAAAAMKAIEDKFELSPLSGDFNKINDRISAKLRTLFKARLKENPQLSGTYKIHVEIGAQGKATEVTVVEDTVHDPVLLGHIYFQLKDAQYPKRKAAPTFAFDLKD